MDVSQLPFNALLGLVPMPPESGFLVCLPAGPQYTNHLGTVHAGALLTVAEAGSGISLLRVLGDATGYVPVVRQLEAKFRKPAIGRVLARSTNESVESTRWTAELKDRGRVLVTVAMEVVDEAGVVVLSANVQWFIAKANRPINNPDE